MGRKAKPKAVAAVDLVVLEAELLPERERHELQLRALATMTPETVAALTAELGHELKNVRAEKDAWEEKRTAITGPLNAAKKAVDALFKPVKDILQAKDDTIVRLLGAALQQNRETHMAALTAAGEGQRDAATLAIAHATPAVPDGLSEIPEYVLTVVDESAIPRHFLCFDERLAMAYVKQKKGQCEIPGVTITMSLGFRRTAGAA
jgi:hypothetical protein